MDFGLGQIFGSLIAGLFGLLVDRQQNITAAATNDATNRANIRIAQMTNAANAEQANLAYERSKPINQVYDMMQAGMSKTAALQKIAGGGQYSPAQMIGATLNEPKFDHSALQQAISSFGHMFTDTASNVMQQEMQQQQLDNVRQNMEFARNEERRKQQEHALAMDEKIYSKWERDSMNDFMSLMENKAQELNRQPKENESMHDYVRALGLQDNDLYKRLPASGRQRAFDHYKQAMEENRNQQESVLREQAAQDAHLMAKLQRNELQQKIDDFKSEKNARQKEYRLRELTADLNSILAEEGLTLHEYQKSLEFNDDGSVKFSRKVSERAKRAWDRLADTIGVGVLKDILSGLVTIAK